MHANHGETETAQRNSRVEKWLWVRLGLWAHAACNLWSRNAIRLVLTHGDRNDKTPTPDNRANQC